MIARVSFRFLTAAILAYAARYLGASNYGMFETALAWSNAFLALNDIGMSTLIVREAARDEKKMAVYFGNTLIVEVVLSIILYAVIIGIGLGIGYDATTITLMMILGAAGLIFEFRKVMRGIFRVLLRLKWVAALEVLNGALYFLIVLWIIAAVDDRSLGLLGIAHARLWVNLFIVLALFILTVRIVRPRVDLKQIPAMVKQSYVFTLYNLFFMLYFQIDQILLSIIADAEAVGIYSAPAKVVGMLLFIPLMVFQVSMPTMYRLSEQNIEKYKRINRLIWRYLVAFGVPAGIGLTLLADDIVPWIFGPEFTASIVVMQVMGFFLVTRFFSISQGNSLTTTDRQGLRAIIQIISVGVNIVLDIWLIQTYGAVGAAIATLITEALIGVNYLIFSWSFLKENAFAQLRSVVPVFAATAAMSGLIFLAKPHLHVIVVVLFGALFYALFLWAFRFFTAQDMRLLTDIRSRA